MCFHCDVQQQTDLNLPDGILWILHRLFFRCSFLLSYGSSSKVTSIFAIIIIPALYFL